MSSLSTLSISTYFFISFVYAPLPPLSMVFAHDIYCTQANEGSKRRQFLAVSPKPFSPTSFQGNCCLLSPALQCTGLQACHPVKTPHWCIVSVSSPSLYHTADLLGHKKVVLLTSPAVAPMLHCTV